MPAYDAPGDEAARRIIERAFPDRDVVQVDVRDIAIGGGGIHCITQQQPV
jgi:agmatine deiminase